MKTLVFATNNKHKINEVKAILNNQFQLKSLEDIGCDVDIPETGATFEENASLKTRYIKEVYGLDCIGDDSGLVVEALNDEPGIYSARYSGSRDMDKNIALILSKLEGQDNRKAFFITVISLVLNGESHSFEGRIDGHITCEIRGAEGFGYDPVFIPEGHNKTFAQMSALEKNQISHRAIAVNRLAAFLRSR